VILGYYLAYIIGRIVPWFATALASKITHGSRTYYWRLFATKLYSSFLNRVALVTPLGDAYAIVRPFTEDATIIRHIFENQIYEKHQEPKFGDTIIDVGAHIGYFTLKGAQKVGINGLIVSIEPCPQNYSLLRKNVGYINSPRIVVAKLALREESGTTELYLKPGTVGHSIMSKTDRIIKVPTTTLDHLCQKLGVNRVDFIKINAEGAEHEILKGAEKTLKTLGLKLAIQVHGDIMKNKVVGLLKEAGYMTIVRDRFVYASN